MTRKDEPDGKIKDSLAWIVTIAIAGFTGAILAYYWYFHIILGRRFSDDPEQWAQFGDYLGGMIGPLVAGLALALLALSVILQRRTLEATQNEMRAAQSVVTRQNFDSRFFSTITVLSQLRQSLGFVNFINGASGRFEAVLSSADHVDAKRTSLLDTISHYGSRMFPYAELLDSLTEMIDGEELNDKERAQYRNIIRSLIHDHEAFVLAVYGLFSCLPNEFDVRAGKYSLLVNADVKAVNLLIAYFDESKHPVPKCLSFLNLESSP